MPKAFKQIAPPVPNSHHAKNAIIMVAIYELVKGLVALGVAAIIFVGHDKLQWIARVVSQALHRIMGSTAPPNRGAKSLCLGRQPKLAESLLDSRGLCAAAFCGNLRSLSR